MRFFAIAIVLALAAPASAEDWSKYIDHGEPTPGVNRSAPASKPTAAAEPRAKPAKATKPAAKAQAKPRAKTKTRRK